MGIGASKRLPKHEWDVGEFQLDPAANEDVEQARAVLSSAHRVLGVDTAPRHFDDADLRGAITALAAARRALSEYMATNADSSDKLPLQRLAALLLQAEVAQASLTDGILTRGAGNIAGAQEAVGRLRGASSVASLAERAPSEVYRMGFSRILLSRIRNGTWLSFSAYTGEDEQFARTLVELGIANPRRLTGALLESEMVRHGVPIYVANPQSNPRVHTQLVNYTDTEAYVAAPIFAWGAPIGLLHADRPAEQGLVSEFDRGLLAAFAEGLGLAFERNVLLERLRAMQNAANDYLQDVNALADDFTAEVVEFAGLASFDLGPQAQGAPQRSHHDDAVEELTRREREVLRDVAFGKTNAQIAVHLFVTEGTVKSHVKNILRKLGAANRTDAVAKYHRLTDPLRAN